MKHFILTLFSLAFLSYYPLVGQTPNDALMMSNKEICLAMIYQNDTWEQYWEGTLLRDNQNIGMLQRKSIMPMLAFGLKDKFNFFASLPYISTNATRGQQVGASGFQDLSLFAKFKAFDIKKTNMNYTGLLSAGFSMPVSSYLSDYMPFSLGLGTLEYSFRGIAKVEHKAGIYIRASYAFLLRTTTEAERDFYYADGPYYTSTMDVSNATNGELALGLWIFDKKLQIESSFISHISLSGDDIRRQNAPQPTNKMDASLVNGRLRYFPSFLKGTSILVGYSKVFEGRNVGQSNILNFGLTYQFYLKKSNS